MPDFLLGLEEWQLALAAFLLSGSFGLVLSRLTWTKGHFWALTRQVIAQKGKAGLVQALLLPLVLDVLASPIALKRSVGWKRKEAVAEEPESSTTKDDDLGVRDARDLLNPDYLDRLESINLLSSNDGRYAMIKVRIDKRGETWTL